MQRSSVILLLCVLGACVLASGVTRPGDELAVAPADVPQPTPAVDNPESGVLGKVKQWLAKRADKITKKFESIISSKGIPKPKLDGSDAEASKSIKALLDKIKGLDDGEFGPTDPILAEACSNAEEKHTFGIVEALDETISPDDILSLDPDTQIEQAATEAAKQGKAGEDPPLAVALSAKILTRADAAVSINDDVIQDLPAQIDDAEEQKGAALVELEESNRLAKAQFRAGAGVFRRRRRRRSSASSPETEAAMGLLKKIKDKVKTLLSPEVISVAVGFHALTFGIEAEAQFDFALEEMGVATCNTLIIGSDSIGVSAEYKFSIGWHGKKQKEDIAAGKYRPEEKEYLAGVSAAGGVAIFGLDADVGGVFSFSATEALHGAWEKVKEGLHDAPPAAANQETSAAVKSRWAKLSAAAKTAVTTFKNAVVGFAQGVADSPITVSATIGVGANPFSITLAEVKVNVIGADCTNIPLGKVKPWKMLLALFMMSGPPGVIVGLYSWATNHADVLKQWYESMKKALAALAQKAKKAAVEAYHKLQEDYEKAKQDVVTAVEKVKTYMQNGAKAFHARLMSAETTAAQEATKVKQSLFSKIKGFVEKIKDKLSSKPRTKKAAIYSFIPHEKIQETHYFKEKGVDRIKRIFKMSF